MPKGRDLPLDSTPAPDDVVVTWKATGGTRKVTVASLGGSPSGAGNQALVTPDGTSGPAALRALVSADLPAATTSAKGAVTLATPSADVTAGHVVQANDARLSNSRTPAAHAATHQPGGSDPMAVDAAVGTGSLRTLGTGATQAAPGNDSRLTDSRTPTAHATSHKHSGTDEVATATPAANAIPKAGSGGTLATGWIPTLNQNTTGTAGGLSATNDVAHGGTGAVTLAAHGVVLGNGTSAVAVTGAGTLGQVLTSNGASADPTFQAPPAGDSVGIITTPVALASEADSVITALTLTLAIGTYRVEAIVEGTGPTGANGGLKTHLGGGATVTYVLTGQARAHVVNDLSISGTTEIGDATVSTGITGGDTYRFSYVVVVKVTTSGTFGVQGSRVSTSVNSTTLSAGCTIIAHKLA